ncbi:unnamed protein product [Parnassius mnemosyne]|uniref:MADF domain-containing protein n=1 Tax=Parnassius mnemosyne TaxID=213953 RepID=A0AAV1LYN9_9NEOP
MEDENNVDISILTQNQYLSIFIKTWETYPELWNTCCESYRDKVRKNNALDKLLDIYKKMKPNSTREDLKKKLNALRTNFRKELKKIHKSKSSGKGTDEVYVPSAWTYYELLFLTNDEQPIKKTIEDKTGNFKLLTTKQTPEESVDYVNDFFAGVGENLASSISAVNNPHDLTTHLVDKTQLTTFCLLETDHQEEDKENDQDQYSYSISSMDPPPTPVSENKKRKKENDQQNLLQRTLSFLEKDSSDNQEEYHLAKVWAAKLTKLESTQKLFAEKAINDILFEAQLGKLNKNSVKVNEHVPYTSSPLLPRQSLYHPRVNYIPSPSQSPSTQDSILRYNLTPSPHSIFNNEHNIDNTITMKPPQILSKTQSHHQPIVTTGIPSQIILRHPLTRLQQFGYGPQDTISQENKQNNNITSNVITFEGDVHAKYTPKEDISIFFQS